MVTNKNRHTIEYFIQTFNLPLLLKQPVAVASLMLGDVVKSSLVVAKLSR